MRIRSLVICNLLFAGSMVHAADENGHFAIKGFGLKTCADYVDARAAQSNRYFQFGGWLNGYLTATNRYEPDTFDIVPWQSTGLLASWLERFCRQQPEQPFVRAVGALVNSLGNDRITSWSDMIELQIGDQNVFIYNIVISRLQAMLVQRGFLKGKPSGELDESTRDALKMFQEHLGLPITGVPDHSTLARLFN